MHRAIGCTAESGTSEVYEARVQRIELARARHAHGPGGMVTSRAPAASKSRACDEAFASWTRSGSLMRSARSLAVVVDVDLTRSRRDIAVRREVRRRASSACAPRRSRAASPPCRSGAQMQHDPHRASLPSSNESSSVHSYDCGMPWSARIARRSGRTTRQDACADRDRDAVGSTSRPARQAAEPIALPRAPRLRADAEACTGRLAEPMHRGVARAAPNRARR